MPVPAVCMELGRRIRIVFVPGVVAGRAENGPETLAEEAQPEDEDDAPRDQTQDGEEALGADVVRGEQRDEAEPEHSKRVRVGHRRAQEDGMAGRAPRSDQVCADDRLAVARRERVQSAERCGDQ